MSERYFKVGPRYWRDSRRWSEDARTLGLYLLTCRHRDPTEGLYLLPKGYITGDLGWPPERLDQPFAELIEVGFIAYDDEAEVVFLRKALKWDTPANPNAVKAAMRKLEELPRTALLRDFFEAAQEHCQPFAKAKGQGLPERLAERFPQLLGQPPTPTPTPTPTPQTQGPPAGDPDVCEDKPKGEGKPAKRRTKVAGKSVSDAERSLATAIIEAFNRAAGSRFSTDAHLTPVVGRIRDQPALTADDHRALIAAVFAVPWWDGAPGPQVIYGNTAQFERSIETWRASTAKGSHGPPRAELAEYAKGRGAAEAVWPEFRERVRSAVPESTYRLWIEPLIPVGAKDDALLLAAPEGKAAWVERRYSGLIEEAMADQGSWRRVILTGEMPDEGNAAKAA